MKRILSFLLFAAFLMPWSAQAQSSAFLSEDFEGGEMPTGWTTDGSGTWSVATGDYSSSTGAGQGTYNAKITHGTTGAATKLITPAMDLSAATAAELSFMHIQRSWSGDNDELRVYYRTSSEGEWVLLTGLEYTSAVATWTLVEGVALPNLSATYQIAFEMTDNYGYGVGVDMVKVAAPATCIKPATLEASAITNESATLTWTAGGTETQYQYALVTAGGPVDWTSVVATSGLTATMNGLSANTAYDFYVRSYCSEADQSDAKMVSFRTACGLEAIPYTNDFENETSNAVPDCWNRPEGQTYPYVSTYSSYESTQCLYFYGGGSTSEQFVVLPSMESAVNSLMISFYYKASVNGYSNYGVPQVGYVTDRADTSTFVALATLEQQSDYTLYEKNLNEAPATAAAIAIRYGDGSSNYGSFYMDNVIVKPIPSCPKPTSFTLVDVTSNSASLKWVAGGTETAWQLCVNEDETNLIDATDSVYVLTNLTPSTAYSVKVRANCGAEQGEWTNVINFSTTAVAEAVGDSWSDNFEAESCSWLFVNSDAHANTWVCGTAVNNGGTHSLYISNDGGTTHAYTNSGAIVVYATKLLTFTDSKYQVSFDWLNNGEGNYDYLRVVLVPSNVTLAAGTSLPSGLSTTGVPTGWIALDGGSRLSGVTEWQSKSTVVSVPAGNYNLALVWRNDVSGGTNPPAAVDNISITRMACSYDVLNLAASAVAMDAATLTWVGGEATQWQVAYSLNSNFEDATEVMVSDSIYNMANLTSASRYYARVRAYCGGTDFGSWSSVVSFKTACGVLTSFPWSENFDEVATGDIDLPCWNNEHIAGTGAKLFAVAASATGNTTHVGQLPDMSSGTITDLTLPTMAIPAANAYEFNISVYRNASGSSYPQEGLRILALNGTDTAEMAFISRNCSQTYQVNETVIIPNEGSTGWYTYTLVIPTSGNVNIVIRGESKYGSATYFDNLLIREIPSCVKPTALTVADSTITMNSASLSWLAGGSETAWKVRYMAAGDEDWTAVDATTNTFVLNGLQANTAYTVEVAAACGETISDWSTAAAFRTACGVEEVPYVDGFENGIYCWRVGNKQSPTSTSYTASVGSTYKYSGDMGMRMYAYYSNTSTHADSTYAILPAMNFAAPGISKYTLSFFAKSYSTSSYYDQHILVGVVSDPTDISTFTLVREIEVTGTFAQYEVQFESYEGTGNYMALIVRARVSGTNTYAYGSIYVDDIAIVRTPTCQPLASVTAVPARTKVEVTLNPKSGLDLSAAYDLVCSATELDNEALEAAQKTVVTESPYTVTGLERETPYYIYVRANCGEGDLSAWVRTTATTRGLNYTDEIIVADGTATNSYLPIYGSYTDTEGTKMQMIYPANMLTGLSGITINSLHYFANGTNSNWTDAVFEVRMMQTETATMGSDFVATDAATLVYTGTVTVNPTDGMLITLATPFTYTEGNLLIEFLVTTESGYNSVPFYGITTTENQSRYFGYSASNAKFLPKVGFGYSVNLDPCPTVTDLNVDLPGDGTTEAHITWTAADADYLSAYEVVRSLTPIADFSEVTRNTLAPDQDSIVYTDLTAETKYYVYVRAICQAEEHSEGSSVWDSINFTTKANCPVLQNLALALTATNAFQASWDLGAPTQDSTFRYILSTTVLDEAGIAAAEPVLVTNTVIGLTELLNDQMYYFYVASACGAQTSEYILDSIKTPVACQAVVNLEAARVEHNRALITWNKAPFATETSWEIGFVGDEENAIVVDTTMHMFIGLTPETAYNVYVKALCGEDSESEIDTVAFTTAAQPGNCATVGTGTSSANLLYTSYGNTYSQHIYTAEELAALGYGAGTINSVAFDYSGASSNYQKTQSVYIGTTTQTSFAGYSATDFIGDLTLVYGPTLLSYEAGWREYTFETPFVWDGTSNIVIGMLSNSTDGSSNGWGTRGTSTSPDYRTIYRYRDNTPIDIDNLSAVSYGSRSTTRPNIQFCFEAKACPDVTALAISDITPTTATATWEPMGQETSWNVYLSTTAIENPATITNPITVNAMTYAMAGLLVDQDYWFYVQPVCTGADSWRVATFRTIATCFPPTALAADSIEARSALVRWTDERAVGNYTVAYGPAAKFDINDTTTYMVAAATATSVRLTGLTPETNYKFAVRANCDDMSSRYSTVASFRTAISCYAPTALVASNITISSAVITWTDLHDAAAYRVFYGVEATFDLEDEETYSYMDVENDTTATLTELNDSTNYKVMVKSVCGENDESAFSADITFRTANTYPYFMPAFTAVPSDWKRYSGLFTDTVRTANLTTTTSGWIYKDGDEAISTNHVKLNIWGTGCKYWFVSPAIDMTGADSTAELVFDAALCDYSYPGTAIESTTNVGDDKFAVIISRDGGLTWLAADRTLWAETADADYQYTSVPATGQRYTISLAQYAGEIIRVAFYGESTTSGGDNDFHIGNISLRNTVTYTEETCQGEELEENHGFEEATTDSVGTFHFEGIKNQAYTIFDLTVYEQFNDEVIIETAYVGDHYVDRFYDFYVQLGDEEAYGFDEVSSHGCDSVWLVTFNEILEATTINENDELAEGDTINWRGQEITEVGVYTDTVRSAMGGVKEIYILTVTAAVPANMKAAYVKVTADQIDWTGTYILTFDDMLAHTVIAANNKDFNAAEDAELLVDNNDTILVAPDFASVVVVAVKTDSTYSLQLPAGNYIAIPNSNAVNASVNPADLYFSYISNDDKAGVAIANGADLTNSDTRVIYHNGSYFRGYANKLTGNLGFILPSLYKYVGLVPDPTPGPGTGIDAITTTEDGAVKVILNGNLYIIRDNQWYDATGRLTSDPRK